MVPAVAAVTEAGQDPGRGPGRKMFNRVWAEAGIGDGSARTTEILYRRELRPVITTGAEIMDQLVTGT
jgi:hypothetical protein